MSSASDAPRPPVPILDADIPEPGPADSAVSEFDWLTELAIPLGVFGLLGSLLYYLIEVRSVVAGPHAVGPLRWVVFWFLLAVIGIARIRTKYGGAAIAGYYTALLAGAIGLFVWVYTERLGALTGHRGDHLMTLLFNWSVVGTVWWAASAVTREATLEENVATQLEGGLWTLLADEWQYVRPADHPEPPANHAQVRPRHPGRLVLWVSLAALVLFAVGQRTIGSEGRHARIAFWCMSVYVLCALLLLALTNLSALRMKVRRRGISLSPAVTPAWIVASAIIVTAIIIFAAVMPRGTAPPQRPLKSPVSDWPSQAERPGPREGPTEGMGRQGTQPGGREQAAARAGKEGQQQAAQQGTEDGRGTGRQDGEGDAAGGRGQGRGEGRGPGQGGQDQPAPASGQNASLSRLLLWLLAAAAVAAVVVFVIAHRRRLWQGLSRLRAVPALLAAALSSLWGRLQGWLGRRPGVGESHALPADPFVDIFARGLADNLQPAEVIDYVYRAFQVYMARLGYERAADQTALEFLRSLPAHVLLPDEGAQRLTRAYVLAMYSPREVTAQQVQGAREIWKVMRERLSGSR